MRKTCLLQLFLIVLLYPAISFSDSFEKLLMPGKVIQGHAKYENKCESCHDVADKEKQSTLCLDCHELVAKDVNAHKGFHGRYKPANTENCKTCHIEHKGRLEDIVKLDKKTFPHQFTDFKLKGAHQKIQCQSCHKKEKKYREAPAQCYTCHKDNPHKERLGKECTKCHSQNNWAELSFDHDKTKFKLTGKHKNTSCNSCHINNKYKNTPKECISCHKVDDVHRGDNGNKCAKCHNTQSWKKFKFDHNKKTKFKLEGRHKLVECNACHIKNPFKVKIKKTCISCHKKDDEHNGRYGDKCQSCHGVDKWKKINFSHDRDTKFKLTGQHKKASCVSCHKGHLYKTKTPKKCISCHKLDDVHKGQTKEDCAHCHNTSDWSSKIKFEHDLSGFPLIGLHAITACDDCHLSKNYKKAPKQCNSCHKKDDVHKQKLGNKCAICHTPNNWEVWQFNHDKDTQFKLDGSHKDVHCYSCHNHPAPNGIELEQACGDCHLEDDVHDNQFGQMCGQCHGTESFKQIKMFH